MTKKILDEKYNELLEDVKNKNEVLMLVDEEGAVIPPELKAKIDSGEIIIVTKEQLLKREGIDLDKEKPQASIPITNPVVHIKERPDPTGKEKRGMRRKHKRLQGQQSFSQSLFKKK